MQNPNRNRSDVFDCVYAGGLRKQNRYPGCAAGFARNAARPGGVHQRGVRYPASWTRDLRALGGCLIVGVNSDSSVRMLGKGDDRPINQEADRMALLAALASVDWVIGFCESTPVDLIEALRPDVLVKGGDYQMDALPESALVRSWGGRALAIPFEHARSTTALLHKVRSVQGAS